MLSRDLGLSGAGGVGGEETVVVAGARGSVLPRGSHKHMGRQGDKVTVVHGLSIRSYSGEGKTESLPGGGVSELRAAGRKLEGSETRAGSVWPLHWLFRHSGLSGSGSAMCQAWGWYWGCRLGWEKHANCNGDGFHEGEIWGC